MKPAVATVAFLLAYFAAYFVMVEPMPNPWNGSLIEPYYTLKPIHEWLGYCGNDRIDTACRVIFAPAHAVDQRVRPETWDINGP